MNSLKKGEGVPLLNFEGGPVVLLLNFEEGPGVPLLNFKGSRVPLSNFEGAPVSHVPRSCSRFDTMPKYLMNMFCYLLLLVATYH